MCNLIKVFLTIFLISFSIVTFAQQDCTGALGDPVININFGSGATDFGNPLSADNTNYPYVPGTPDDGAYTISKSTNGMHNQIGNGWHQIPDHTPNDLNGYMMVVNASEKPGIFYRTNISGLCPGTTYEFAAWIVNLLNYSGKKPNITFTIQTTTGTPLKSYSTKDIPDGVTPNWVQYATTFKTTDQTDLVLIISNSGPGGIGNDIALDDITFRACGPIISSSINNVPGDMNVCLDNSGSYDLAVNVSASSYTDPVYQWQSNTGGVWSDIVGQNTLQTTANLTNAPIGSYQYRIITAERQNINSVNCRVASSPLIININAKPNTVASNSSPTCVGSSVQLSVTEGTTFKWTGPNGFTSTDKNPIINDTQLDMAGDYTVTATSNGCTSTSTTTLVVLEPFLSTNFISVTTCENHPVQLFAFGGISYKWLPSESLSSSEIANPIANPKETTIYTVTASNGICSETATVKVTIIKNAVADAGKDLKAFEGSPVTLNGKVTGDNVTYFWTPSDYLDDPTKLNPKASPPSDITYTLHAVSADGCLSSTDDVAVSFYPKIVIPNSFTPNGDGVNDTWNILAINSFPNARIKVTSRYGNLVYQNTGNYTPWDGKSNGKDLPAGTYYYTIYFNDDFETFSGWIFITH